MALLDEAIAAKKYDLRMVGQKLDRGVLEAKDVESQNKALPDDADNAIYISLEELAAQEHERPSRPMEEPVVERRPFDPEAD